MAKAKKAIKTTEPKDEARPLPAAKLMPLLLILAIALGVTYFLVSYQVAVSYNFSVLSVRYPVVSAAQLENTYRARLTAIISDYLKTADLADRQFLARTKQLKQQLLALIVPAEYREKHLALVLSLDKIETESQNGDLSAVAQEMEKIRQEY